MWKLRENICCPTLSQNLCFSEFEGSGADVNWGQLMQIGRLDYNETATLKTFSLNNKTEDFPFAFKTEGNANWKTYVFKT